MAVECPCPNRNLSCGWGACLGSSWAVTEEGMHPDWLQRPPAGVGRKRGPQVLRGPGRLEILETGQVQSTPASAVQVDLWVMLHWLRCVSAPHLNKVAHLCLESHDRPLGPTAAVIHRECPTVVPLPDPCEEPA